MFRFLLLILALASVEAIRLPVCHFLMRDWNGVFVEVMRRCPPGTSYCATRVSNATGISSMVVDYYEYYCENERNIAIHLKKKTAPPNGCYAFGPLEDDFVCFCDEDFCNSREKIENLFIRFHQTDSEDFPTPSRPLTSATPLPIPTKPVAQKGLLNVRSFAIRRRIRRSPRHYEPQAHEQKVTAAPIFVRPDPTAERRYFGRMQIQIG